MPGKESKNWQWFGIIYMYTVYLYTYAYTLQINVKGKVKKKLFGMGKPIYTCAHTINVLTTVIKWVNVRNSSHVWHGKISGGGGKWSNTQSWTIVTILLKAPGAMNSHAMCPANGLLTICAMQLCLSIVSSKMAAEQLCHFKPLCLSMQYRDEGETLVGNI